MRSCEKYLEFENERKKSIWIISVFIMFILIFSWLFVGADNIFGKSEKKLTPPKLKTEAVVLYCIDTDKIVYQKNPNMTVDPFSTTKVMTAYLAIKNLDLNKTVTVSQEAASIGNSTAGLLPGEKVRVKDLLYAALLPSGNDAAHTLAEAVSGNEEEFAKLMTKTAKDIGCKATNFTNSTGLMEDNHNSTAYDMMLIFKKALTLKKEKEVMGTLTYMMPSDNKRGQVQLYNTCAIMKEENNDVYAAKTGSWDYENSIVFAFKANGNRYICSMMKSNIDIRDKEAVELIKYARSLGKQKAVKKAKKDGTSSEDGIGTGVKIGIAVFCIFILLMAVRIFNKFRMKKKRRAMINKRAREMAMREMKRGRKRSWKK